MGDLSVKPEDFSWDSPDFIPPVKIGEFSLDEESKYQPNRSQQKFISWPSGRSLQDGHIMDVKFDLNYLIEKVVRKDGPHDETPQYVQKWISLNMKELCRPGCSRPSTDFVCRRGLLTKLMCTPYNCSPWIICATCWRGTVYLCAFETAQEIADRQPENARQKKPETRTRQISWGFKFKQYLLADTAESEPDTAVPVVETAGFYCVLRARLGRHSLVYSAEMDGMDPLYKGNSESEMAGYVELKTSRQVEKESHLFTLRRHKMLKWWCRSFLAGTERVLVGFRDDEGIVHSVQCYSTSELPKRQVDLSTRQTWKQAVCMNFGAAFLDHVKAHVTGDAPRAVWRFDFDPQHRERVTCRKLAGPESERYRVLPDWYIESAGSGDREAAQAV